MKKAFSLLEVVIVITLLGVMTALSFNYINISTLTKQDTKTQLQSHFNIITSTILQCKELSNVMPIQSNGSIANNTLLNSLECNTTTPYKINGEQGAFIPNALNGFGEYRATQNANEFYFSTSVNQNSLNDEVLQDLNNSYSTQQYELTSDATTRYMNFYLSR